MYRPGDVIEFETDEGHRHRGRVYIVDEDSGWLDYYCFDDPMEDGCGRFEVFDLIRRGDAMSFEFIEQPPKRLAETRHMDKDTWLEWRRRGITGTDCSAVLGYSKFTTPLMVYEEKFSNLPQKEDNNHMKLGRDMEQIVANWFCDETGKRLEQRYAIFQHATYDWMLANIDRKVVGESAIAEMKIANFMFSKDQWGPTGSDQVPVEYLIQVNHYMIVMGVRKGYLGVIFTDTREFRWYEFNLNDNLANHIIKETYRFWMEHVLQAVAPEPLTLDDLNLRYPEATKPALITNQHLNELCQMYEDNRQLIKSLEKDNERIKVDVGRALGDHKEALVDKTQKVLARFTTPKPRTTCDLEKLKLEFPDAYEKCTRQSKPKRTVKMIWQTLQQRERTHESNRTQHG